MSSKSEYSVRFFSKHLYIFNILLRTQLRALLLTITIVIIAALYRTRLSTLARSLIRPTFSTSARYQSTKVTANHMQFQYRASQTRGGADHGWLKVSCTHCRKCYIMLRGRTTFANFDRPFTHFLSPITMTKTLRASVPLGL